MPHVEFTMPRLGESITEAAIIKWFKSVGDTIEDDEILLEVATDKVDSEVPSTISGTIVELLYKQNEVVEIGAPIAIIDSDGAIPKNTKASKETKKSTKTIKQASTSSKRPESKPSSKAFKVNENVFISPLVESIAKKHHISYEELARIPASGNDGRLRKSDVMSYISEGRPFKFAQPSHESGNPFL